ncbi:hypothetical protein KQX54_000812 [Cotesia glomerata]|uniref:Uncharacterized protein n=1 Tax=Cotesia glomerata TaxID=32391 RepID=A0AAV7IJX1_COTGL|nr:hypothetical protein KQX54_000812 [Cotesia glomerata]
MRFCAVSMTQIDNGEFARYTEQLLAALTCRPEQGRDGLDILLTARASWRLRTYNFQGRKYYFVELVDSSDCTFI